MNRREALRRVGALAAAGLAGCVSDNVGTGAEQGPDDAGTGTPTSTAELDHNGTIAEESSGSGDDTPAESETPSPTDHGAADGSVAAPDVSFTVVSRGPGTETNEATVSFGDEVLVEGTIAGKNGCYTAELGDPTVADGTLTVPVRAVEEGDGMCTQSLVAIDYEATFAFEGSLPRRVVVEHDSLGEVRTVADVER